MATISYNSNLKKPTISQFVEPLGGMGGGTWTNYGAYYDALNKYEEDQKKYYLNQISKLEAEQEKKTKARENEVRSILDEIIRMYGPEGSYGQSQLTMIEQQKSKDIAAAQQSLVSSGLYGTTLTAGLPSKWEQEVGMPARQKLEDLKAEKLASAKAAKAQFITDIQETPIDYSLLTQLLTAGYGA
jgi:hypothetical protein